MEISHQRILRYPGKVALPQIRKIHFSLKKNYFKLIKDIKSFGYTDSLDEYDLVKLSIFNQINFFQFLAGSLILLTCFFNQRFPLWSCYIAALPASVSVLVLYLNKIYKHQAALVTYFVLHPLIASLIFMNSMSLGLDLYFILYGILAVFFLKEIGFMIFSISFSMMNFFILSVVLKQFIYELENINNFLYLVNQGIAIVFIFWGLYLIKNENTIYQLKIVRKSSDLQKKNVQIQVQADKIQEDAILLKKQTKELTELNAVKNKLFGILSHDLKGPMYALRDVFSSVHQKKMTAAQLKSLMPEVVNDLNYTVSLMDNLLQWVKTQMQSEVVYSQKVDIGQLLEETIQVVRLQADRKQITIEMHASGSIYGIMDKEMIRLVLRNLLSNAIKFTPENGTISAGINANDFSVEVFIQDSGSGISPEALSKINGNSFYTTRGTANESGTGLGLMLCKEYLHRNKSQLIIESEVGKGSIFSFALPKSA